MHRLLNRIITALLPLPFAVITPIMAQEYPEPLSKEEYQAEQVSWLENPEYYPDGYLYQNTTKRIVRLAEENQDLFADEFVRNELGIVDIGPDIFLAALEEFQEHLFQVQEAYLDTLCNDSVLQADNDRAVREFTKAFQYDSRNALNEAAIAYYDGPLTQWVGTGNLNNMMTWARLEILPELRGTRPDYDLFPTERIDELYLSRDHLCSGGWNPRNTGPAFFRIPRTRVTP